MDTSPGYGKKQKGDPETDNKRNDHSPRTLKSQYGQFQNDVPGDRNGESGPKFIPKYQRDISGIEEKVILHIEFLSRKLTSHRHRIFYGLDSACREIRQATGVCVIHNAEIDCYICLQNIKGINRLTF